MLTDDLGSSCQSSPTGSARSRSASAWRTRGAVQQVRVGVADAVAGAAVTPFVGLDRVPDARPSSRRRSRRCEDLAPPPTVKVITDVLRIAVGSKVTRTFGIGALLPAARNSAPGSRRGWSCRPTCSRRPRSGWPMRRPTRSAWSRWAPCSVLWTCNVCAVGRTGDPWRRSGRNQRRGRRGVVEDVVAVRTGAAWLGGREAGGRDGDILVRHGIFRPGRQHGTARCQSRRGDRRRRQQTLLIVVPTTWTGPEREMEPDTAVTVIRRFERFEPMDMVAVTCRAVGGGRSGHDHGVGICGHGRRHKRVARWHRWRWR